MLLRGLMVCFSFAYAHIIGQNSLHCSTAEKGRLYGAPVLNSVGSQIEVLENERQDYTKLMMPEAFICILKARTNHLKALSTQ